MRSIMENQRLPYLLSQYLSRSCSAAELEEFYTLVASDTHDREVKDLLDAAFLETGDERMLSDEVSKQTLDFVFSQAALVEAKPVLVSNRRPVIRLWRISAVAASIAIMIFSAYFYFQNRPQEIRFETVSTLPPGGNKGTLTLANGQKINLSGISHGKLADEQGIIITRSSDGRIIYTGSNASLSNRKNILTTARGEMFQVTLPDGTSVWLNAASELKYPVSFEGSANRIVQLSGEGYFEVKKDAAHPFIVETMGQKIKVLGTHFNVNAYLDNQEVKTTLLEGRVQVNSLASSGQQRILKPGEQSTLQYGVLKVAEVDLLQVQDWKNGEFIFSGERLESIMRKISRWYDVNIYYTDDQLKDNIFVGSVPRMSDVAQVLDVLELTGTVKFKIEVAIGNHKERRIKVMR